ncbi:MAG: alpha-L-arabinofuranosidase [Muribaculaceae bacterium]|nr:alpha-L-arabinofuranosidase [Muribaculaceae bacterium]
MIQLKQLLAAVVAYSCMSAAAVETNDSTFIYLCATDDGQSGLVMAESKDPSSGKWHTHDIDQRIVGSDFGAWGPGKKMYNPRVFRNSDNGEWQLLFNTDPEGTVTGYTASPDLINWTVQEYRHTGDTSEFITATSIEGEPAEWEYKGKKAHGSVFKVPTAFVDRMKSYQAYRKGLDARYAERAAQDEWRFAGIDNVTMTLTPQANAAKPISDKFIGIFFEDINYAADGGLYAELVQNRDFEYSPTDRGGDKRWHPMKAWSLSDDKRMTSAIDTAAPLHPNNPHYIKLTTPGKGYSLLNEGFDGIKVDKDQSYNISMWIRQPRGASYKVELLDGAGKTLGTCTLKARKTGEWENVSGTIRAKADCADARLAVTPQQAGTFDIDMVSLMPENTFMNRKNGLRPDLAQALADLHPKFVRFPGGCVAHGDGIDNMYDWKGSIGRLEARIPKRNLWGYHQTRGLGYHEFFQMCEDFGAEPLPVLAAGVPCQNSSTAAHCSHDVLTTQGQQSGIPMSEMGAYIQDILDLVEYANGDTTTTWGRKRAEAGHPAPFNLKMLGIGNEDLISDTFKERFTMIFDAVKAKYPEIEVVGTVGPFYEGPDYEAGWEFAREKNIPVVDEHYYVSPGWLIHNGHYYDSYDRQGTKVYLGEYASHLPSRASTLEAALSNALYLTNVERNADVVTMTSYAPLLAKEHHTQWRPDLIYFNNSEVKLTPDYYVQKMYGNNSGTRYVPANRSLSIDNADFADRLGHSIVIDEATGDTIVRLVNMTPATVSTNLGMSGDVTLTLLAGGIDDTDTAEQISETRIDNNYVQPPYSFSVLRFKNVR